MRCEVCRPLLEPYFDGELDEATATLVGLHLAGCETCARAHARLEREQELFLSLGCEAAPAPTFWTEIEVKLAGEKKAYPSAPQAAPRRLYHALATLEGFRLTPALAAALVLVTTAGTVGVMRYLGRRDAYRSLPTAALRPKGPSVPEISNAQLPSAPSDSGSSGITAAGATASKREASEVVRPSRSKVRGPRVAMASGNITRLRPGPGVGSLRDSPDELIREAERKYVAAIALLSRDVRRRRPQLDPASAARLERTLAALDRNIEETRRALREHPDDPLAARYVLAAYDKKVQLLRAVADY